MGKIAVFPGSFDPITKGHESVIIRALPIFDEIIIAVGQNPDKASYFSLEQRIGWLDEVFKKEPRVKVVQYSGLTVDFCRTMNAGYILRGLRTSADFEFERVIGVMNKSLNADVETVFLLGAPEYSAISSSIVRDIYKNGGDVNPFIPDAIRIHPRI